MCKCEPYLWKQGKPAFDAGRLNDFEKKAGIRFPVDFKTYFSQNYGDKPVKSVIPVGKGNTVAGHFLHFQQVDASDSLSLYEVEYQFEDIEEFISDKVVPFLITVGSDLICFDFRDTPVNPRVVLVISGNMEDGEEKSVKFVAKDFESFLGILQHG